MRNRALGLERRRLPWACSERHWCDFSGRSVSSVTMKGRAAAGFGAHGRSVEVQPGRGLEGCFAAQPPKAGVGKCSGALFSSVLSPQSPLSFRNPKSLFTDFSFQFCN